MRIGNPVVASVGLLLSTIAFLRGLTGLENNLNLEARLGYIIGLFLGTFGPCALGILPLYLAWRGLSPVSTMRFVQRARLANIAATGLIVLISIILIVAFSDKITSFLQVLPFLLVAVFWAMPYALNFAVLGKQKATLGETKAAQPLEPLTQTSPDIAVTVSTTAVSAPPSLPPLSSNYFVRHWRGELSLGISYWLNSNLAGIVLLALMVPVKIMGEGGYSLRTYSLASIGVLLLSIAASVWSIVGIWRSANHHVARGGSPGWANAARGMVVLGTIVIVGELFTKILPQINELALIATGNDPLGSINIKVAGNGQSVIVYGVLREGSAAEVQKILDAAPGATSLVLNSAGGRLLEAKQLASVVRSRALNTYVEDQCASACTFVFLAGKDRAATPNAQIGFHQPSFPGLDVATQQAMTNDMLDVYRAAELPETFIQRVAKTPPEDMWYPTRDELIAAHVITRVSLGGEAAISSLGMRSKQELFLRLGSFPLFQAIEKRFPGTTSEAVERGWAEKERGGSDSDIQNAMRSIISEIYPKLLKTTDVSILDSYVKLMIREMSAAQALGGEACAMLLAGKLNIMQTLPGDIVEEEQQLLLHALANSPMAALTPPDPAQLTQAMQKAYVNMPQKYLDVVADTNTYASQPGLVCEGMIALFRAIDALPSRERHVALRGMLQGED